MSNIQQATVLFLVKRSSGKISEILLGMKKRGFGAGKWNGIGGKFAAAVDKTINDTARRETREEIGVEVQNPQKVARLMFHFPHKPEWDQLVYAYLCEVWQGEPVETEEMAPQWFNVKDIPYKEMWWDDRFWLPDVLAGKKIQASFIFNEQEEITSQKLEIVSSL